MERVPLKGPENFKIDSRKIIFHFWSNFWGVIDHSGFNGIGPGTQNIDILLKTASRNLMNIS